MSLEALIASAINSAFESLSDLKQEAQLVRTARGAYDPATGGFTTYDESHPVTVVVTGNVTTAGGTDNAGRAQTSNKARLAVMMVPLADLDPQIGDHLVLSTPAGEVRHHVVEVKATRPGRSTLLWELEVEA